jgi:transglutaminase-like putative cysteine protease
VLPPGWRCEASGLHGSGVAAAGHSGDSLVWIARNLPAIPEEPFSLPLDDQAPALSVRWASPAPLREIRSFASWTGVAAWYAALTAPQTQPDPDIRQRSNALVAGADSETERARRIARFVQAIRYVSVQIGDGRYQPHSASDVLRNAYGDCKDKAGLLQSMLATVGVRSWLVLARADDPLGVDPTWPSPLQFNHCIVAIALPEAEKFAAGGAHAALGPLLFFDPTDPFTPFGELPESEQGSVAVVADGAQGGDVRLPATRPGSAGVEREVDITLADDGSADVHVRETSRGAEASRQRSVRARGGPQVYESSVRLWCAGMLPTSTLTSLETRDDADSGRFHISLDAHQAHFGQLLPDGSVSVAPIVFARVVSRTPPGVVRKTPVLVPRFAERERLVLRLPAGRVAEDLPADIESSSSVGTFSLHCEARGNTVTCESRFELRPGVLPPRQFDDLSQLLRKAGEAARASFVLVPAAQPR